MAPTSSDQTSHRRERLVSSVSFLVNHDGHSEPLAKLRRRPHHILNNGSLWSRQTSSNPESSVLANSARTTSLEYGPTTALHASIVSQPIVTQTMGVLPTIGAYTSSKHVRTTEIMLIVAGGIFAVLLCSGIIIVQAKKLNFFAVCFRRCRVQKSKKPISNPPSSKKGILNSVVDDYEDLIWNTPTRMVHFENTCSRRHSDQETMEPVFQQNGGLLSESPLLESTPTLKNFLQPSTRSISHLHDEAFQTRLHIEEEDITSTLTVALRDILAIGTRSSPTLANVITDGGTRKETESTFSLVATDNGISNSTFESLCDGLNGVGKHASTFGFRNRPRQGSDASVSSKGTTVTPTMGCFSSADSRSSTTSIENEDTDSSGEDEFETTYELRRAQTQSLEIKKGVLVAWQCADSASTSIGMPSKVVISEPCQISSNNSVEINYTLGGSIFRIGELGTTQTVSSLEREVSSGTLASFSSTSRAEGWCTDGEGFLQPPVPYLMVTRPSTSSIFTTDSNGSSVSVDLNDFPHPPSPAQPPYLQLTDQMANQKRVWDNHPLDSTMAQKRSTVERFIMMYETE